MNRPVITAIAIRKARNTAEYLVRVHAPDNFMVTGVQIILLFFDGSRQTAAATRYRQSDLWRCRIRGELLSRVHTLRAVAFDFPGNAAEVDYMISPVEAARFIPGR